MSYVIVNKKKFWFFIFITLVLFSGIVFAGFSAYEKYLKGDNVGIKNSLNKFNSNKEIDDANKSMRNENGTSKESGMIIEEQNAQIASHVKLIAYENIDYHYNLAYPEDWYMNNDSSSETFREVEMNDGKKLMVSGHTFWSNYPNINEFSPSDKPDDFRLLGLAVYKDISVSIEEFALKAGFDDGLETVKVPFSCKNQQGFQFFSPGLNDENPKITVIFKKDDQYYVFNLGFTNSDPAVVSKMENIIKTLELK